MDRRESIFAMPKTAKKRGVVARAHVTTPALEA
jgi:hypothetical protein